MREWIAELKPEELPGDLQLVAQECGIDVAIRLAEKMGGVSIYIRPIDSLLAQKKEAYIIKHFNGSNHKELAIATRYSERWVYEVLSRDKQTLKQKDLFARE